MKECFELLDYSRTARPMIDRFCVLINQEIVEVRQFQPEEFKNPKAASGYRYDGAHRLVYLKNDLDLNLKTALLAHEWIHALDEDYHESYERSQRLHRIYEIALNDIRSRHGDQMEVGELPPHDRENLIRRKVAWEKFEHWRLFRTERRAYTLQNRILEEISRTRRGFRESLLEREGEEGFRFFNPPSDSELIEAYLLNPLYF